MLRIINSVVLLSAFVSSVSFAGDVSQPAANATANSNVNAVQAQTQTQAKLDEKNVPVSPAVEKQEPVAAVKAPASKPEASSSANTSKEQASPAQKADKAAQIDKASNPEKTAAVETKTDVTKTEVAKTEVIKTDLANLDKDNKEAKEATTDLKVVEFVLANQVVSREPKDVVEAFSDANERGFAFARLNSKTTSEITFVWTRDGHECARITSPVHAAKQWRTFSSVKLRKGEWKVQLLDQNKVVLAEKTFTIQ